MDPPIVGEGSCTQIPYGTLGQGPLHPSLLAKGRQTLPLVV